MDVEFANLRAGFRWAADHHDLDAAATIAAHTTLINNTLQRYESIGWAIELLDTATRADLPQLARLYGAASLCFFLGQPDDSVRYAQTALALEADPRYDGFRPPLNKVLEAAGHAYAGRIEQAIEICFEVAARPGPVDLLCLALLCWLLPAVGRDEEARTLAEEALPEDSLAHLTDRHRHSAKAASPPKVARSHWRTTGRCEAGETLHLALDLKPDGGGVQ